MRVFGLTDIGLHRKRNEDRFFIDKVKNVFAVCDGMGGHKGGDVASKLAVESIRDNVEFSTATEMVPALLSAVTRANQMIWGKGKADDDLHEMGTTLTAAAICEGTMVVAHVGDSSLFLFRDDELIKITKDHTLAEQMYCDGLLKKEDMRTNVYNHVLTRAVGVESKVEVDIYEEEVQPGDRVLICTDGLTDMVEDEDIYEHLATVDDPQDTAQKLLNLALSRGGLDNVTIVLLCV